MSKLLNPGFSFFGLWEIKWYGVIIACGMLAGIITALITAKKKNYRDNLVLDLALVILPCAIVGARLYYVAFYGVGSFAEVFEIWNGGMAIYGGVIGGLIGIIVYCLIRKFSILEVCDLVAPPLILGQAIGRWGNYMNQEAYGSLITNPDQWYFPFGVYIERTNFTDIAWQEVQNNLGLFGGATPDGAWFMATFFYESMCSFVIFVGLILLTRFVNIRGIVTGAYLVLYGIVRSILEGFRADPLMIGDTIRVSQVLSIIIIVIGLGIIGWQLYKYFDRKKKGILQPISTLLKKPKNAAVAAGIIQTVEAELEEAKIERAANEASKPNIKVDNPKKETKAKTEKVAQTTNTEQKLKTGKTSRKPPSEKEKNDD
ncbi:MAG: prolipoprotein diacylglyceryl transferase [Christensenellaceae bacterium]|jgi:phosphatidylglycerol:prolipoprotein diacylglycerol transferase|nr:prolipoprotein diacylglyceryl transferase [Christensenellaceae bacterium]